MRAMILAAGFGSRLWPLTVDRTKPAVPVLGQPLIGRVAEYLARFGINEIIVNLHHEGDSVRRALGDGTRFGVKLTYIEEPEILGTSGAMDNARDYLEGSTFIVVNGKIVTDIDLAPALSRHAETGAIATLILLENSQREKFSEVYVDKGTLKGFGPPPSTGAANNGVDCDSHGPLMFTGIQILDPRIFSFIPRGIFSHSTTDVYPQAIVAGERINAEVAVGMWYELSTIARYLEVNLELLRRQNLRMFSGDSCTFAQGSFVDESVLWDRVAVGEGASVTRCVVGDGVVIPAGSSFDRAAIVRAEIVRGREVPAKALTGNFEGDNFVVSLAR